MHSRLGLRQLGICPGSAGCQPAVVRGVARACGSRDHTPHFHHYRGSTAVAVAEPPL